MSLKKQWIYPCDCRAAGASLCAPELPPASSQILMWPYCHCPPLCTQCPSFSQSILTRPLWDAELRGFARSCSVPRRRKREGDWSPGEKYDGSKALLWPQHGVIKERQGGVTSFIGPIYSVGKQAYGHRHPLTGEWMFFLSGSIH